MSSGAITLIVCLLTIALGLAATHPLELREYRWLKIALSLPIVLLITSVYQELGAFRGYFAMFGIGVLGFIWKSPIAHCMSGGFMKLILGNWNQPSGIRAEIGGPRALFKHGEYDEALVLTQRELEKDPMNYDGLLLLADIYEALSRPTDAQKALQKLLNKPALTADQRNMIQARIDKINERQLISQLNRR